MGDCRGRRSCRGCCQECEGYRGGGARPGYNTFECANLLGKSCDLFAQLIDGRPVVFLDLIDYFYHDQIVFAGCGSPNFQLLVYLVE